MLKLVQDRNEIRVVDNEVLTPTYTVNLAKQIVKLIKIDGFVRFFKLSSKVLGLGHVVENL